jgi:AAHS family 4-hydroxybenzoate transporter-like MFS transporter
MAIAPSKSARQIEVGSLLENAPWRALQKAVILLSALAIIFDGMDIQLMGFAIPSMAKEWNVARSAFAPILAFGLFGVAAGTAFGGLVGDRIGRKNALVLSVLVFGASTLGFAFAHTISALFVLRLIAGLGIGGALPNATTITAEFTPARRRAVAVTLSIVCIPLGGVLAGIIASHVLVHGSWRTLFLVGGLSPLILAALLIVLLPESPRYLARHPEKSPQLIALLHRIGIPVDSDATFYEETIEDLDSHSKLAEIFGPTQLRNTLCLWMAFFFTLVSIYLVFNWLPSILTARGLDIGTASQALALYNFGGIFGALAFAVWINHKGSRIPLLVGSFAGVISALFVSIVTINRTGSHVLLLTAITAHGLFANAVQTTMYALAASMYVTRVRATGVAAALAVGRMGAIVSAFLGSYLLAFSSNVYFTLLAIGMACAFASLFFLKKHITVGD